MIRKEEGLTAVDLIEAAASAEQRCMYQQMIICQDCHSNNPTCKGNAMLWHARHNGASRMACCMMRMRIIYRRRFTGEEIDD